MKLALKHLGYNDAVFLMNNVQGKGIKKWENF